MPWTNRPLVVVPMRSPSCGSASKRDGLDLTQIGRGRACTAHMLRRAARQARRSARDRERFGVLRAERAHTLVQAPESRPGSATVEILEGERGDGDVLTASPGYASRGSSTALAAAAGVSCSEAGDRAARRGMRRLMRRPIASCKRRTRHECPGRRAATTVQVRRLLGPAGYFSPQCPARAPRRTGAARRRWRAECCGLGGWAIRSTTSRGRTVRNDSRDGSSLDFIASSRRGRTEGRLSRPLWSARARLVEWPNAQARLSN